MAQYLYGNNYRAALNLSEDEDNASDEGSTGTIDASQSLEDFVEEYIHVDEEDHPGVAAFNFIQSYVAANRIEETTASAEEVAIHLGKPTLTGVINLLSGRVPRSDQKKPTSEKAMQKEVAKWLQSTNGRREFMFRSTNNLKDLIARKNIKIRGSKTIDRMIDALAGTGDQAPLPGAEEQINLGPADAAIKAIISKSFLPHQKGEQREACTMGHLLERPVLEKWIKETSKRGYPIRNLKINGAYSAGLVEKQDSPWAKDSIDFVLTVSFRGMEGGHHAWGVEIKSRVNAKTAADEEEFVSISRNKHEVIDAGETHKMINAVSERFQILHHAYVYDFDKILFAVGDSQSEILQSTIVNFDDDLKENYGKVLKDLKDLALSWAYDGDVSAPIKLPDKIIEIGKTLAQIKDDEALEGSANLWLSLISQPLPMPSLTRLIPAVCAYWNAVKSGSDTTTKLMDDRVLYPPHVNCETIACTRVILLAFVVIHCLIQMNSAKKELDTYPTLSHYRNAASHRSTFQKTILHVRSTLNLCIQKQDEKDIVSNSNKENSRVLAARSLPNRQRVHGVLPKEMSFGVTLPFVTPKKIKKQIEKGTLSEPICQMYNNCTGRLVQIVDNDKRKRCALCSKVTSYYCAGCKSWFCFPVRLTTKKKSNEGDLNMIYHNLKGKREIFFESCFAIKHKEAWEVEDQKTSAAIATP